MQPPPNLPEQRPPDDEQYAPPEMRPLQARKPTPPVSRENEQVQSYSVSSRSGSRWAFWGLTGATGCLVVILVIVFAVAAITAGTVNGAVGLVRSAFSTLLSSEPPTASVVTSQTIVTRVRPLGQLVSTSAQVAKADIEVSVQQGRFGACNHTANHVASATIEAGVDLLSITEEAARYNEATDTYTIVVPRPVITSCSMDFIDQYERRLDIPTNIACVVDWDDARQIAQYEALESFREDAIEGGLLQTAERDTQIALTSFISALTGSQVIVEFTDPATPPEEMASGCNPQPPRDWNFSETEGRWVR